MGGKSEFKNLAGADFKRATGIPFAVAVICTIFCMSFDSWNDLILIFTRTIPAGTTLSVCYYYFNSLAVCSIYSAYLIPMLATLPFATDYCVEEQSGISSFVISRVGKRKYCLSKMTVCTISGGLALALGSLLFILALSFKVPLVTDAKLVEMVGFPYHSFLSSGAGTGYFIIAIYLAFLRGGLWSAIAMTVSAYYPNKYVTAVSPFILSFIFSRAYNLLRVPGNWRLDYWLVARASVGADRTALLITTIVVLAIIFLCALVFTKRVRRRVEHVSHT